jgi:hypothetical protein
MVSACSDGAAGPQAPAELNFCDALPILESKCQRCHQDPPMNGAPFPLLTYSDTQEAAPLPDEPERKRAEDMRNAVETNSMPFMSLSLEPPVSPLTCAERATLLDWLRKGAFPPPEGQEDCHGVRARLLSCAD